MDLWSGYVTTFMRDLREALDGTGAGRRVRVAVARMDQTCAHMVKPLYWRRRRRC